MQEYITYTLKDSLINGKFDDTLGSIGGNLFLSDKYKVKEMEDESIPASWTSIGGVELYYQLNTTFEDGKLTDVSLPWNHSVYTDDPMPIDNCDVAAILVPVNHDLVTGADDTTSLAQSAQFKDGAFDIKVE